MQEHVETFFAQVEAEAGSGLPDFVKDEFDVALVPRPRLNLIRFHGVLAPNAKLRSEIIPGGKKNKSILYRIRMTMCRIPRFLRASVGGVC